MCPVLAPCSSAITRALISKAWMFNIARKVTLDQLPDARRHNDLALLEETSEQQPNGDLKLGLPADAGARLHIDTVRGEIYSDFEVDVQLTKPVIERNNDRGGAEVRVESVIVANINGGGCVIRLKTLNGDIQISKSD